MTLIIVGIIEKVKAILREVVASSEVIISERIKLIENNDKHKEHKLSSNNGKEIIRNHTMLCGATLNMQSRDYQS